MRRLQSSTKKLKLGDLRHCVVYFPRMDRRLNAADILIGIFVIFLSVIGMVFAAGMRRPGQLILINAAMLAYIYLVAWLRHRTRNAAIRWLHDWNTIPLMVYCYKEVYFLIRYIYGERVFDVSLIAADRWMFGTDPTVWLVPYSTPVLTEVLQVAYSTFYIFFLIIGGEIYRRGETDRFGQLRFAIAYGFMISYLGYLLVPAVGPRFTLHDYAKIAVELPGEALTPYLRRFVDTGESIPAGATNAVALAAAQRDAFPSGHAMMTLVLVALGFRWRIRSRFLLLVLGVLLLMATVYLRYHYVIDVLAGAVLAVLCLSTTDRLYRFFIRSFRLAS